MRTSETLSKISPDLVTAIGELKGAPKAAENTAFKSGGKASRYATLESCVEASRDVLAKHGLCVIQAPGEVQDKVLIVTTRLLHKSGEWIESDFHMPLTKWSPHEAGSATTYARRFALMAALNLAPIEDDDGNAASGVTEGKKDLGPSPMGADFPGAEGVKGRSSYAAKKDGGVERFNALKAEIESLGTMVEIGAWTKERTEEIKGFPEGWRKVLREALDEQKHLIAAETEQSEAA